MPVETQVVPKKQPYEKPVVEEIKLVVDEMVLGNCKSLDGLLTIWGGDWCGYLFQCYNVGS